MKLSIAIIVLATIIVGYQCAPYPDWNEDFNQRMQDVQNRLHERLEAQRLEREENMRKLHERLEAQRLEREENMRKLHERLEAQRLEREENMKKLQEQSKTNDGVQTVVLNTSSVNGVHIYHRVSDQIINNVRERTVTDYTSASGKTEIKKYKCEIPMNSPCVLDTTEVKDGPPDNVYYS